MVPNVIYFVSALLFLSSYVTGQNCQGGAQCLLLKSCPSLLSVFQSNGYNAQVQTLLKKLQCGFIHEDPMVCCPPAHEFGITTESILESRLTSDLLPDFRTCGVFYDDKIYGGTQTELDEHPWTVLLGYEKPNRNFGYFCGGVLISAKYVLTAGHCIKSQGLPKSWKLTQVRLGEWNTKTDQDCIEKYCSEPPQDIKVEQIIPHEQYSAQDSHQHHDIALLRLATEAKFNDFVRPICLPVSEELRNSNYQGLVMEVAGWGKTETRSESDVKLKVKVPVVNNTQCAKVYKKVQRDIVDTQLCAGGEAGRDSCRGDSGGSLMGRAPSENWVAIGVVSYGPSPCGTEGWPGVYTRVSSYVDWIISKLRP